MFVIRTELKRFKYWYYQGNGWWGVEFEKAVRYETKEAANIDIEYLSIRSVWSRFCYFIDVVDEKDVQNENQN